VPIYIGKALGLLVKPERECCSGAVSMFRDRELHFIFRDTRRALFLAFPLVQNHNQVRILLDVSRLAKVGGHPKAVFGLIRFAGQDLKRQDKKRQDMSKRIKMYKANKLPKRDPPRPDYQKIYNNRTWHRLRALQLAEHPLCAVCESAGTMTPATVVDHIKPHRGNADLFFDMDNLQSLCKQCHDRKTMKEKTK